MDHSTVKPGNSSKNKENHQAIKESANDLLNDGKKLAGDIYQEGVDKVKEVEEYAQEYSDKLVRKIRANPLTAVLVAAGVGVLLSAFLKK